MRVYWKMVVLGVQRLNDSKTLSSVHVVILMMWRFTSGIVAFKKTTALCIALLFFFVVVVLPRRCSETKFRHGAVEIRGKLKIKSFYSCEIKPVNPIRENLTFKYNHVQYL